MRLQIERIDLSIDNTTLQKGERKQLQVTISPEEASDHKVPDGNPRSTKPSGTPALPSANKIPLLSNAIIGLVGLSLAS